MDVFTKKDIAELAEYIKLAKANKNYELECSIKYNIDTKAFAHVFSRFKFDKLLNEDQEYTYSETLDINVPYTDSKGLRRKGRVSVENKENISEFCKTNRIQRNNKNVKFMSKTPVKVIDYRLSLQEHLVNFLIKYEKNIKETNDRLQMVNNIQSNMMKTYRYKERYSMVYGKYIRVDLTLVKQSKGQTFIESGILTSEKKYEIEIELLNDKIDVEDAEIIESFDFLLFIVIKTMFQTKEPMNLSTRKDLLSAYLSQLESTVNPDDIINKELKNVRAYFIGPQPITLERINIVSDDTIDMVTINNGYSVTDKADGMRMLLLIYKNKVYLMNNQLDLNVMDVKSSIKGLCILDGEYVEKDMNGNALNKYYVFDCYVNNNVNVHNENLIKRLENAEKIIETIDTKDLILLKKFYFADNKNTIYNHANDILVKFNSKKDFMYKIDGLIFTPIEYAVGSNFKNIKVDLGMIGGSWKRVFKWKPPEESTIDFKVGFIGEIFEGSETCSLKVGFNTKLSDELDPIEVLNETNDNIDNRGKYIDLELKKCMLPIDQKYNQPITESGEMIYNDSIVEFAYNNNTSVPDMNSWIPIRLRKDKTFGNDYLAAVNVLNTINEPVTHEMIIGKEKVTMKQISDNVSEKSASVYYANVNTSKTKSLMEGMRFFHNIWIKDKLLIGRMGNKGLNKTRIFDIACGKGGDMRKWIDSGYEMIVGNDIATDNITNPINGIYARYKIIRERYAENTPKMLFFSLDATQKWDKQYFESLDDTNKTIVNNLWGINKSASNNGLLPFHNEMEKKFSVVSCQFAIHYFFKNRVSLDNFLYNVDQVIQPGGYFIGTTMDGSKVMDLLKKNSGVLEGRKDDNVIWSIKQVYNNGDDMDSIGLPINVYVQTIGKIAVEYIVKLEMLVDEFAKIGLKLLSKDELDELDLSDSTGLFSSEYDDYINSEEFDDNGWEEMSDEEKTYSFINRWFIFKKE